MYMMLSRHCFHLPSSLCSPFPSSLSFLPSPSPSTMPSHPTLHSPSLANDSRCHDIEGLGGGLLDVLEERASTILHEAKKLVGLLAGGLES